MPFYELEPHYAVNVREIKCLFVRPSSHRAGDYTLRLSMSGSDETVSKEYRTGKEALAAYYSILRLANPKGE